MDSVIGRLMASHSLTPNFATRGPGSCNASMAVLTGTSPASPARNTEGHHRDISAIRASDAIFRTMTFQSGHAHELLRNKGTKMPLELGQVATVARVLELGEGQIWRRDEKRFRGRQRYVRIQFVCIGGQRVQVQGCRRDGSIPAGSKSTEVAANRFGRRGGFLRAAAP